MFKLMPEGPTVLLCLAAVVVICTWMFLIMRILFKNNYIDYFLLFCLEVYTKVMWKLGILGPL